MWEQIRSNKIRSFWVVALLGALLVGVGVALGFALGGGQAWWLGGLIAAVIWFILWMTSRSSGDNLLLNLAGAKEVPRGELSQLRNVVEEMSIAAALDQVPRVFLIDDPSPNAFAVGRNPAKCAVAVTTGLVSQLSRDELQGVVAHEIGHIKNRDVALMTTAGIMLGAIVMIGDMAMHSMRWGGMRRSRTSSKSGGGGAALIALVILILAPFLAQLLYFSLSRRREFLADACGARYSRYPEGLASALEKIGGLNLPQTDQSSVTAPMYLVRPLKAGAGRRVRNKASVFSTHPSLQQRIQILRAMGAGADFKSYDQAFCQTTGKSVIGARSLAEDRQSVPIRSTLESAGQASARAAAPPSVGAAARPSTGAAARPSTGAVARPPASVSAPDYQKARQASDAFLAASHYQKRSCHNCAAVLKVPAKLAARLKDCPRCGSRLR